nr:EOG090X0P2R [Sida crystallina]
MASEESQNVLAAAHVDASERNPEATIPAQISAKDIEKQEEEKLKSRYTARPMTGHSAFLAKRLAKGQKYFDSGDYQMAKQKAPAPSVPLLGTSTGDAIPTPDSVPTRKTSIIQSKLASPAT